MENSEDSFMYLSASQQKNFRLVILSTQNFNVKNIFNAPSVASSQYVKDFI